MEPGCEYVVTQGMRAAQIVSCLVLACQPSVALASPAQEPSVTEKYHRVSLSSDEGSVKLVVRREFVNHEAEARRPFHIPVRLPPHATAIGFRVRTNGAWRQGELLSDKRARTAYEKATISTRDNGSTSFPPALLTNQGWIHLVDRAKRS